MQAPVGARVPSDLEGLRSSGGPGPVGSQVVCGQFVDAYRGSQSQGLSYLPGIADSFFTKWFWTVSLGNPRLPLTLLIFDGRVAGSATGKTWALQGKNVAERYVYFCELVEPVATAQGLSAEQVEYGLYCAG